MNRDPLIVAARALAVIWYVEHCSGTYTADADAWAKDNFIPFLADATEPLGKALLGEALTPAEEQQADDDLARAEESYKMR